MPERFPYRGKRRPFENDSAAAKGSKTTTLSVGSDLLDTSLNQNRPKSHTRCRLEGSVRVLLLLLSSY